MTTVHLIRSDTVVDNSSGVVVLNADVINALQAADAPDASNQFLTESAGDARYAALAMLNSWRNRIVMIGDSIVAGVGSVSADPAAWLRWQMGEGAYVLNKGIGGNNLQNVIDRLSTDVIAYRPGVCVLEVGTNDLGGLDSLVLEPMKTITSTLLNAGIIPLWCTLLPRSDIAAHRPQIRRINTWLMAHAANYGLPIADTGTEFSAADGSPKTGYLQDGLHPATLGGKAFANVVYNALPDTARRSVPWRFLGDAENLITNPTMTLDSNADGVPNGWFPFANGVGTFTLEAHPTEGNWMVITKGASAAQQTGELYTLAVTAGHTYRIAFDVDYAEVGTTPGFNVYITLSPSATNKFVLLNAQLTTLSNSRIWYEFTVPANDTTAYIYVWTALTTNAAVLKVGRIRAWDVTTAP